MIALSAQVDIANRIHDTEMRDAALGNLVKRHARAVLGSPARMNGVKNEIDTLLTIADMMADEAKRASMFAYVKKVFSA